MPPSQLKRLKTSLREQGITGPQKSKKDKKKSHGANGTQRMQRQAALQGIRDSFNPFEIKAPSRPSKFETTSSRTVDAKAAVGRPGVTKSMGEEARRRTLLPEMQRRNKMGGILDRRIGESDPTMTPEERALQRFAREKQRSKGASLFDLEEADDEEALTHMGQALDLKSASNGVNDLNMDAVSVSDAESEPAAGLLKRRRSFTGSDGNDDDAASVEEDADQPVRKKTKAEVMKEVMAKSKLYKYERQKAKDEDDDLREELDKGMGDMLALLQGYKPPVTPAAEPAKGAEQQMNPERLAMLNGMSREQADKDYDTRLRQLAQDQRAAPADRTKTAEEKAADEAQRLKDLEASRQRRMRGDAVEESDEEDDEEEEEEEDEERELQEGLEDTADHQDGADDAADFGFTTTRPDKQPLVLEDEDEFMVDDELIASGSELDDSDGSDSESPDEINSVTQAEDDEEDEFVRGILHGDKTATGANQATKITLVAESSKGLAFAYACPRAHDEMLATFKNVPIEEVPTVVQRIRALYHPSLSAENKEKLADFSVALVQHISYMGTTKQPLPVVETLIRHLHSLSRTYPDTIAKAFRAHLEDFQKRGSPTAGDLIILMAIGSIYPTSDHFHQVVTPATTLVACWLGMTQPTAAHLPTGAFLVSLCLRYQRLSKRYIPEAMRFTLKALQLRPQPTIAELQPHIDNLLAMANLWASTPSFPEIFAPASTSTLQNVKPAQKQPLQRLQILLQQARLRRRPLRLHNHKPLAIKTSVPKFEEGFNPDKHYDPDRERADATKLRAEYKRERKGAVRELRKDANFVAREQLRDKRERDAEYEKKYKRLVAEIQGEEGHEAKEYEREKRMRKSGRR